MTFSLGLEHAVAIASFISCFVYLFRKTKSDLEHGPEFLTRLAAVGIRNERLAWVRATIRSLFDSKKWVSEGYAKYSKSNIPFIIPSIERGPTVIVPPRQLKGIYGLPENVLDVHATQDQTLQSRWTIWDKEVANFGIHISVIRHQLTRNLEILTPTIAAEIELGFKRWWGTGKDWKEISVWDTCLKLIAGAANSAFCGKPLCRDTEFLDMVRDHAMAMFGGAIVINATPKPFKALSGVVIGFLCHILFRKTLKKCLPFIRERLDNTSKLRTDPTCSWTPPSDGLQWIIDECHASGNPAHLSPERVCHRLLLVNDISMHSTSFTVHNVILDLASVDESTGYIEALREECRTVLQEAGGTWTFDAVKKLKLVDSAIRESMRLTPFASTGLPRTLENATTSIPPGTVLSVPIEAIHHDEDLYPDSGQFKAFRFSRPLKLGNVLNGFPKDGKVDRAQTDTLKSSATLDDAFLGFGFGRHACPGRFFALNEMKMFVAYMLLNYDLEHIKTRPKLIDLMWLKLPFHNGRVRVRRRDTSNVA
ncbi:ent-kaurene oxidase [Annulohypoxylon truncatum]|uniref:ent-kaurene oxidase n=1 Tax=Annulohypoxylon truncatum TaxID=327061 RepID=UPI0020079BAE|nr:ent-kaurene oxidase [Annulohypoxylon truncatum]KAI1207437.1 ent-kaurene oxidase [Annulohypoxylon truncatum]